MKSLYYFKYVFAQQESLLAWICWLLTGIQAQSLILILSLLGWGCVCVLIWLCLVMSSGSVSKSDAWWCS